MNLTGQIKIWRKDYNNVASYSTQIKNTYDGSRTYLKVQLPKDADIENGTTIDVSKSFLGCYNYNGEIRLKIIVMEFEAIDEDEIYAKEEREAIQNENSYNVDFSSDLPF